jgi:hypothetical protein
MFEFIVNGVGYVVNVIVSFTWIQPKAIQDSADLVVLGLGPVHLKLGATSAA